MNIYRNCFKRLFDIAIALPMLAMGLPFVLTAAVFLFIANRGKVLFLQQRPGRYGRPFHIIKLKTMNDRRDSSGELLPDAERMHRIGRIVRKSSIDELPQLINVLKGDMSLVGPRPLLMEYLPLYNDEQKHRHDVRPGITGWAQINGRNAVSWPEKFALDVWYVRNLSMTLDLKIMILTLKKVLFPSGINQRGQATMGKFSGND